MGDREKKYVHMLNATLCATGRAICCLLETYQDKDGVHIPEVLVPFMGGLTFLPFVRDSKLPDNIIKAVAETAETKPKNDMSGSAKPVPAAQQTINANTPVLPVVNTTTTINATSALTSVPPTTTSSVPATASKEANEVGLPPAEQALVDKIISIGDQLRHLKAVKVGSTSSCYYLQSLFCLQSV
jgi:seryl-tRNA synthetase